MRRRRVQLANAINGTHCCAFIFVDMTLAQPSRPNRPQRQKWYVIRKDG
jgi:hypothetical protein